MVDAYVCGVGMTPFGRHAQRSLSDMAQEALRLALEDTGLDFADVQAVIVGNAVQGAIDGQHGIRGQVMLHDLPLKSVPIVNVENACASASTAFHLAVSYVRAGMSDVVVALGAEKMITEDRQATLDAFQGSWDVHHVDDTVERLNRYAEQYPVPEGTVESSDRTVFMDVYAAFARGHMAKYGTTQEMFAAVSAKNHQHSVENPLAQYRRSFSIAEVLESRGIAWPLTLPMCAPVSDGAAAAVVCSAAAAAKIGQRRNVGVRASVLGHGGRWDGENLQNHASRLTAMRLWEAAAIDPDDIDVAEVHDATAVGEIQQTELLGLFSPGEGGPAALKGETTVGGRIPVNPSGGLESRGHPIGATGLAQIHELVMQLRGEAGQRQVEGARLALAENAGGLIGLEEAAVSLTVLEAI